MAQPRSRHTVSLPVYARPPADPLRATQSLPAGASATTPLGLQGTHNRTFLPPTSGAIGARWRQIQGAHDWEGLLEPLDECLRLELIRYGQFAQVAYDAFDFDKHSQYCGSCRYSKDNLFEEVDLHTTGYTVTMYIYATADVEVPYLLRRSEREDAWSSKSNWMGYVAVCTDEREIKRLGRRDIVIAWRGTVTGLEWAANLKQFRLVPCNFPKESKHGMSTNSKVERGFQSLYTSAKEDSRFNKVSAQSYLVKEIKDLIDKYKGEHELSITICGHSLGSALAILSAYDLAESKLNEVETVVGGRTTVTQIPITVFSFAGPRVGNLAFKSRLEQVGVKVLRVVNKKDVVPHVPGLLKNVADVVDVADVADAYNPVPEWLGNVVTSAYNHVPRSRHMVESVVDSAYDHLRIDYTHVGVLLELNDEESKHLDQTKAAVWHAANFNILYPDIKALGLHHNLEVYLHLVDGYSRYDKPPSRDPVLVNKRTGFLKDDKYVPKAWWQPKHKGMQYSIRENRYYQPDRDVDDIPVPPEPEAVAAVKAFIENIYQYR